MPRRKRNERERDLADIARLYLRGMGQYAIRDAVNEGKPYTITQSTVSKDLKELRKRWLDSSLRDFDNARAQELVKVDKLEAEYWQAWERSMKEKTQTTTGRETGDKKTKDKASVRKEGRDGNPQFLQGVQWCIDKRCELLGLNQKQMIYQDNRVQAIMIAGERIEF